MQPNTNNSHNPITSQNMVSLPSYSYQLITKQVDDHNDHNICQYTQQSSIHNDNLLLRQYTNIVYKQYTIDNPFFKHCQPKYYSQDKNSQNKKCIKLSKKSERKVQIQYDFDMPPSKIQQIKNKNFLSNQKKGFGDATPTKNAISTKNSNLLKSTARTHLRNKSGLTTFSSTGQFCQKSPHLSKLQNINASRRVKRKPLKNANISISEFLVNYNQNRQNYPNNSILSGNNVLSKTSKNNSQAYCYCPICQQNLSEGKISDHQNQCTQLQKLYSLDQTQLKKYVNWKISQHLSSINSILTYPEFITPEDTSQSKSRKDFFPLKIFESSSINNIIQQCGEEVRKCLWFQVMRKKLTDCSENLITF